MELNKIEVAETEDVDFPQAIQNGKNTVKDYAKKSKRVLVNYGGLAVGAFIISVMVSVMTTRIEITSFVDLASLGLNWFIMFFCSYAMYISCCDSGMRAGYRTEVYESAKKRLTDVSSTVKQNGAARIAQDFCNEYILTELKSTRETILMEAGLSYAEYEKYQHCDKNTIKDTDLPVPVQNIILKANAVKPIVLTAQMLISYDARRVTRSPLGMTPAEKRRRKFIIKFFTSFLIAAAFSTIAIQTVTEFTLATLASGAIRIMFAILSGFMGYTYGYDNATVEAVGYYNDKADLCQQLLQYAEEKKNDLERSNSPSGQTPSECVGRNDESRVDMGVGLPSGGDDGSGTPNESIPRGSDSADG